MLHAVFPFLAAFPCIVHQGNTLLRQASCSCGVVALHRYAIQNVSPENTWARGLLSSLDQVGFGWIRYSSVGFH